MVKNETLEAYLNSLELTGKLAETVDRWSTSSRDKFLDRIENVRKILSTHIEDIIKSDPDYYINETKDERLLRVMNDRTKKMKRYFEKIQ